MSIGKYRPGVWSSYTITPGYTGAREALAVTAAQRARAPKKGLPSSFPAGMAVP